MATGIIPKYQDPLYDSGWQEYEGTANNDAVFTGKIYYRVVGKNLTISSNGLHVKTAINSKSYRNIYTLPSGYKPSRDIVPLVYSNASGLNVRTLGARITTNGDIYIYTNNESLGTDMIFYLSGSGCV